MKKRVTPKSLKAENKQRDYRRVRNNIKVIIKQNMHKTEDVRFEQRSLLHFPFKLR